MVSSSLQDWRECYGFSPSFPPLSPSLTTLLLPPFSPLSPSVTTDTMIVNDSTMETHQLQHLERYFTDEMQKKNIVQTAQKYHSER